MKHLAAIAVLAAACASSHPPLRPPDVLAGVPKAKVLLVGTFHFDDPKLDTYKPKFPYDTMSVARQREIAGAAAALAAWRPTKIGLEFREDFKPKAASPRERVLVIVGAGHLPILRHLFESVPDIELVPLESALR